VKSQVSSVGRLPQDSDEERRIADENEPTAAVASVSPATRRRIDRANRSQHGWSEPQDYQIEPSIIGVVAMVRLVRVPPCDHSSARRIGCAEKTRNGCHAEGCAQRGEAAIAGLARHMGRSDRATSPDPDSRVAFSMNNRTRYHAEWQSGSRACG
jgi:hypothetical protein